MKTQFASARPNIARNLHYSAKDLPEARGRAGGAGGVGPVCHRVTKNYSIGGKARWFAVVRIAAWCLAPLVASWPAHAATIWNGPLVTFTQAAAFTDPPTPGDRDPLTANVSLTRGSSAGMFNGLAESYYTHNLSPAGTEWAFGDIANYASLSYTSWETLGSGRPVFTLPGQQLVVHLIADDIYLSLKFTYLGGGIVGGSGFSYVRSSPAVVIRTPAVAMISPTNGAAFAAPATISLVASASETGGSVTNVSFFDDGLFLAGTNTPPYAVTAALSPGSHALTAVATDPGGITATSTVVNITVSAVNVPPTVTITNPAAGAVFGNTDPVTIQTSASDPDGSVTNLQVFNGTNLLQSFSAGPYNFTGTGISGSFALGTNIITALATDNLGATTTSAPVQVIIARYLPAISNGIINLLLQPVATNLAAPDYAISPPGDHHRLFVLEQSGWLRIIQDGVLLARPALDLQSRVQPPLIANNANDERGLLGLAFHPGFGNPASPGYQTLYTYNSELIPAGTTPTYVAPNGATNSYRNVVNEWKISVTNANVIDPTSRREIISFGKNAANHNGGTIAFGPDGYAYLGLGDGGNANDAGPSHLVPGGNAQSLSTPLGKLLRFDPLNPALTAGSADPISANGQYRIPAANPFKGVGQVPEIYAYGLRNPYRFSFDTVSSNLYAADVGQNNVEEIDRIQAGGNYGWPVKEGDFLFNQTNGPAGTAGTIGAPPGNHSAGSPAGLIDPVSGSAGTLEYDHNEGISITGGFVYRGAAIPELYGKYVFGDLALQTTPVRASGRLFYADLQTGLIKAFPLIQFGGSAILPTSLTVHGFGQDADGELYALVSNTSANGNGGLVYKLAPLRLTVARNVKQVDISWPVVIGHLETQTNTLNTRLGANWVTVSGSALTNHITVSADQAVGSVFYRLVVP